MSITDLDPKKIFIKTIFDGYDFIQTTIGQNLIPNRMFNQIIKTTYVDKLYDNTSDFIEYCQTKIPKDLCYLTPNLMNKYKVGYYNTQFAQDKSNPWYGKDYILFNHENIKQTYSILNIVNIGFWVCPAFDNAQCIGIGYRVINTKDVMNAFKWIFMSGNNIIYGKEYVKKEEPCYIVEGFRDYVALRESGYNVIGLGSVIISHIQKQYIDTLREPILLLDNDSFGLKKTLQYKDQYRIATLCQTPYKDAWDTYINNIPIKIMEIK